MERELKAARDKLALKTDESLFNPRLSTPQEMAPVIVANMGEDKWRRLIVETDAAYKLKRETAAAAFKRKRQTPAG